MKRHYVRFEGDTPEEEVVEAVAHILELMAAEESDLDEKWRLLRASGLFREDRTARGVEPKQRR